MSTALGTVRVLFIDNGNQLGDFCLSDIDGIQANKRSKVVANV
jgi:hypothetical protein